MKRPVRMVAAGVGLTLAMGAAGYTHEKEEARPVPTTMEAASSFTPRIQDLAGRLLELANQSPTTEKGKPPFSVYFTVPVEGDGNLSISVQTSSPEHNPRDVNQIELSQPSAQGNRFSINLLLGPHNRWNATCANDVAVDGSGWTEAGEETVYPGSKISSQDALVARLILDHTIQGANMVLDSIQLGQAGPLAVSPPNACRFNIGG